MYRKILYFGLISGAVFTFAFGIFCHSFGYNIVATNHDTSVFFNKISPQGWGFFADNPRSDLYFHLYSYEGGALHDILPLNSDYKNIGGLQKNSRMINYECGQILLRIKPEDWHPFMKNGTPSFIDVDNSGLQYLKTGKFAIVKRKIPAYLWRNLTIKNNQEVVYVNCIKK